MGVYYRAPSKRVMTANGANILYSNWYGKAPGIFAENTSKWDAFCTRADNTARHLRENTRYTYIMMAQDGAELREDGESAVAIYSGQAMLHDGFWDKNIVGKVKKVGGRWQLIINPERVAARKAEMEAA